jgi:membrane protein
MHSILDAWKTSASLWLDRTYLVADRALRGWPSLFVRTALAFGQDDGATLSRSIAYYALFSVFPLLLALITLASSVLGLDEAAAAILQLFEKYVPVATGLSESEIAQSLVGALGTQSTVGILGLVVLIWSASGVFTAVYRSVNRAWQNPPSKIFWREKFYGLAVVLLMGFLLVASTLLSSLLSVFQSWQSRLAGGSLLGWQPLASPEAARLWESLSAWLPPLISVATFIVLYRTIPRSRVTWRDVWLGGLITGLLYDAARRLFTWYLVNISFYSLLYGSVGAILGFLLWCYLSAMILLLGAEFTAQHTAWRRAGHPLEPRPLSQWGKEWSR